MDPVCTPWLHSMWIDWYPHWKHNPFRRTWRSISCCWNSHHFGIPVSTLSHNPWVHHTFLRTWVFEATFPSGCNDKPSLRIRDLLPYLYLAVIVYSWWVFKIICFKCWYYGLLLGPSCDWDIGAGLRTYSQNNHVCYLYFKPFMSTFIHSYLGNLFVVFLDISWHPRNFL